LERENQNKNYYLLDVLGLHSFLLKCIRILRERMNSKINHRLKYTKQNKK